MLKAQYYDLLEAHDWLHNMSDAPDVWRRGNAERVRLVELASGNPEFQAMFEAYQAYVFSGVFFGTLKLPKPERPAVVTFEGSVPSVHRNQMRLI
jgi:hypothetical protein